MKVSAGVSGFQYKAWRGTFYPADLPDEQMLGAYAQRLPTCEINNTFYRMPKRDVVAKWAAQAGPDFTFVIKASRRISHLAKLKGPDAVSSMAYLGTVLEPLGPQLGAVLIQVPPTLRRDDERLKSFLENAPRPARTAFELVHESWNDAAVDDLLRAHGCTRVMADREAGAMWMPATLGWAYVRLRSEAYSDEQWRTLLQQIAAAGARDAMVFFKHEETAAGALMAERLLAVARDCI